MGQLPDVPETCFLYTGCNNFTQKGNTSMSNDNKTIIREFMTLGAQGDFDRALEYLDPSFVANLSGMPGPLNRDGFRQFSEAWHAAVSDEQLDFQEQIAEGDRIATRLLYTATHTGNLQNIPPTGKRFTIQGMFFDRVVNGKVVERTGQLDAMGMMMQLGVIPAQ
jgi:predicted ester cyclase